MCSQNFCEHVAALHELVLEVVDLVVGALPLGGGGKPLDALHQHAAVPGAVVDDERPGRRQVPPEAPEVVVPRSSSVGAAVGITR